MGRGWWGLERGVKDTVYDRDNLNTVCLHVCVCVCVCVCADVFVGVCTSVWDRKSRRERVDPSGGVGE